MRWIALWMVLVASYLAAWAAVRLATRGALRWTAEDWAYAAAVPLIELLALAVLAAVRGRRSQMPPNQG